MEFLIFIYIWTKKNEENILFHWVDSCCVFSDLNLRVPLFENKANLTLNISDVLIPTERKDIRILTEFILIITPKTILAEFL